MRQMLRINPADVQIERFWSLVDRGADDECWPWLGHVTRSGYGAISMASVTRSPLRAHRVAYTLERGEIPEGLVLDHLCRSRSCCNPAHLEPVTNEQNIERGEWLPVANAAKTHCIHGHEFTPENTYITPEGHRACRTCTKEAQRRANERAKAERRRTRADRLATRRAWLAEHPDEPMSNSEANAIKTHCHRGHPFDEANTCITKSGKRRCRTCNREAENRRRSWRSAES